MVPWCSVPVRGPPAVVVVAGVAGVVVAASPWYVSHLPLFKDMIEDFAVR